MSTEVVKQVVEMVFQNASFEKNAGASLETLSKLKEALNFEGATKGLQNLGKSFADMGINAAYDQVYKLQGGFNALDVVATRVIQNITDKVFALGTQLLNGVTLQPLKDGFAEYELQMNSVQTIMSSTGESIGTVNSYLDKLNEYADKTIYSFSDMTSNIGKFTNAGVGLDQAVAAIQGVSNVAAVSGANTQEASRAMYNFAQALSAGSIKLIDWKSIENANMATVEFKEQLIQTALALGTVRQEGDKYVSITTDAKGHVSEAFDATSMFNDSLSAQWMTTDVLVQTLEQYSTDVRDMSEAEQEEYRAKLMSIYGDEQKVDSIIELAKKAANAAKDVKTFGQLINTLKESLGSGWTKTWQMVFGDLNEAKVLWTGVNDVLSGFINNVSDSRNTILEAWHKSGYTYNQYGELVKAVYNEQGKLDGELSVELVENGKKLRKEMGGRDFLLEGLANTYTVLSSAAKEFSDSFSKNVIWVNNDGVSDLSLVSKKLIDLSRAFYDVSESFKNAWVNKDDAEKATELMSKLRSSFDLLTKSLRRGYNGVSEAFSGLGNIFSSFMGSDFVDFRILNSFSSIISKITTRISEFGKAFNKHFGDDSEGKNKQGLITFLNSIVDIFESKLFVKFDVLLNGFDAIGKIIDHLIAPFGTFSQLLGVAGENIQKFMKAFNSVFYNEKASKIDEFFNEIADDIIAFSDSIKTILGITSNGSVTGFTEFFDQLLAILNGDANIDVFNMLAKALKSVLNVVKTLVSIAAPIFQAFVNTYGPALTSVVSYISQLIDRVHGLTSSLVLNNTQMQAVYELFKGIFEVIRSVGIVAIEILSDAFDGFSSLLKNILPDGETFATILTDVGKRLQDFAAKILGLTEGDGSLSVFSDIIKNVIDGMTNFFVSLKQINLLEKFSTLINNISDGLKRVLGGTEDMSLLDVVADKIKSFLDRIKLIFSDEQGKIDFVKVFEAGGIGVVIKKIIDFFKEIKDKTADFEGFLGVFKQIGDAFKDLSESIGEKFKADTISTIAKAVLEIAGALFIIAMIDPLALSAAIAALVGVFNLITTLLASIKGFSKSDTANLAAAAGVIQTFGNAVLMMAGAIAILGIMDPLSVAQGLIAIALLIQTLEETVEDLSKVQGDMPKIAGTIMAMAIALNLLVIPVKILGGMDLESLSKGLIAVGLMLAAMTASAVVLADTVVGSDLAMASIGLLLMAESIKVIAKAIVLMKDLSWEQIGNGLAVMVASLVAMVGVASIISYGKMSDDILALGAAMVMLGTSMNLLAFGLKGIAGLEWADLGKGLAVFAVALVGLGIASYAINGENLLMIGGAIFLVATAISQLAITLNLAQVIAPICTVIAASLTGISASLEKFAHHAAAEAFLQFIKDAILFLPKLAISLAQALIDMVVTLGNGAAKIVGAVVNLGKAVIQGITSLLPDVFSMLTTFFAQLWTFLTAQLPNVFGFLTTFFAQVWAFLTAQLPNLFNFLTTLFTNIFLFLQTEGPLLIETVKLFIMTILQAIIEVAPLIGETLLTLLQTWLSMIQTAIPEISNTLLNLLLTLLSQLATYIPQMTQMAMSIIQGFLQGVSKNIGQITESAVSIAIAFINGVSSKIGDIVDSAFKLLINFIDGLATAIDTHHNELFEAVGKLILSIVNAITDGIANVGKAAGDLITGEGGVLDSVGGFVEDMFTAGANLVQGFVDGLLDATGLKDVWDAACGLATEAWNAITGTLDEHSPSRLTYGGGKNFAIGFANGIIDFIGSAVDSSVAIAKAALSAFDSAVNSDVASFEPVITPVIDDSNIQNGIYKDLKNINNVITGSANISGTIEANNALKHQLSELAAAGNDYSSIISEFKKLRDDLSTYNDNLSKLSIVMDSGTLVGSIVASMDNALGMRQALAGRGVI